MVLSCMLCCECLGFMSQAPRIKAFFAPSTPVCTVRYADWKPYRLLDPKTKESSKGHMRQHKHTRPIKCSTSWDRMLFAVTATTAAAATITAVALPSAPFYFLSHSCRQASRTTTTSAITTPGHSPALICHRPPPPSPLPLLVEHFSPSYYTKGTCPAKQDGLRVLRRVIRPSSQV